MHSTLTNVQWIRSNEVSAMVFKCQLFTNGEDKVNKLLYFDIAKFHRRVTVGNKYYRVEQEVGLLEVVTRLHIHYNGMLEGRVPMDVTVTIRRQRSILWFPEKYYIEVYWGFPMFKRASRELTSEEYGKLIDGIGKLLEAFIEG